MVSAWLGFLAVVATVLALRRWTAAPTIRNAVSWGVCLTVLGLSFATVVYVAYDENLDASAMYLSGYLLECALSVDIGLVVAVVLRRVPAKAQPRLLWWVLVSTVVVRTILFVGGAYLVSLASGLFYLLGVLFVLFGIAVHDDSEVGALFGLLAARKRLLLAIVLIEALFALDSLAVLSISTSAFILVTSNVMATLTLRSLSPVVERAAATGRLRPPRIALVVLLLLVGVKMILHELVDVPPIVMLLVLAAVIAGGITEVLRRHSTATYR